MYQTKKETAEDEKRRRNHSAAFNAKVALSTIKGDRTLAELADQFDLHPNQIQSWKKRLVENAPEMFDKGGAPHRHEDAEVQRLRAKIGELTMEKDFFPRRSVASIR
jgi:transposase-like protein